MSVKFRRFAGLAAGAVLVIAGITGCGGDGGEDESSALTQEEFVAQANALCAEFRTAAEDSTAEYDEAQQAGDIEAAADAYAKAGDQMSVMISGIDGLGAPEGDEGTIDEIVSLGGQMVDNTAAGAEALRTEDLEAVGETNTEADKLRSQFDAAAGEYGLTGCVST
ncbi:MAG TPA: hypothetical protein VMF31_03550 [Solirubrobacterales bacterium]|nr:hypothetical protein [Solirubrobacterales bacterium]